LDIHVIRHKYKKPNVKQEILDFVNKNGQIDDYKKVCIIGDRLFVDVLMGSEFGFFTILVNPISEKAENFVIRFVRKIENLFCKM